ncbi:phosphonate C-P lyase system protein PhnH [Sporosarcina sp. P20a]|uniref:phosphonate C-P lyase system protein PhnH n=1 Tax=Sporosarcina sp. P20a TaxID=2048256 RepID=UPI000C167083|nr:phosphonate C-P lyase system protein PhnH [Sporosarcina sp. P20a]PIC86956.1 phosphonate C-P lyase system protein PhnH [Sporosarcina sp. P20a]
MAIDQVHDLQYVYRKLLHSMSRPGTISSITEPVKRMDYSIPCSEALLLTAMTLLDGEVTFHIISNEHQGLIEKISEYTSAKYASIHEADFVIVPRGDNEQAIQHAMEHCKIGSLIDPQQSSTWLVESPVLQNDGQTVLKGPGIQTEIPLQTGFPEVFWRARNQRTNEFPMGIDLIFIDQASQIACVPRTTAVAHKEVG